MREEPDKIWEVKDFKGFEAFLRQLAAKNPLFYLPIYEKFQELHDLHKLTTRLALICGFLLGLAAGLWIATLL